MVDDAENERNNLRDSYDEWLRKQESKRTGLTPEQEQRMQRLDAGLGAANRLKGAVSARVRSIFDTMEDLVVEANDRLLISERRGLASEVDAVLAATQRTVVERTQKRLASLIRTPPAQYTQDDVDRDVVLVLAGIAEALKMPVTSAIPSQHTSADVQYRAGRAAYNLSESVSPSSVQGYQNALILHAQYEQQAKAMPESALKQRQDAATPARAALEDVSPYLGKVPGAEPTEAAKERKETAKARAEEIRRLRKAKDMKLIPGGQ